MPEKFGKRERHETKKREGIQKPQGGKQKKPSVRMYNPVIPFAETHLRISAETSSGGTVTPCPMAGHRSRSDSWLFQAAAAGNVYET